MSVPEPINDAPWNAETIRCPALAEFGVIDIALLSVPTVSVGGEAGVITVGSNEICMSYEITPNPVRSPTVIGIITRPGVALMFGNDTGTPLGVPAAVGVAVLVAVLVAVFAGVLVGVFVDVAVNTGVFVGVLVDVAVNTGVFVGVFVAVFEGVFVAVFEGVNVAVEVGVAVDVDVAVGVSVGVGVNVAVLAAVGVFVAVFVGVEPPGIVTLPLEGTATGSPSLNINPGWNPPDGLV